MQENSDLAEVSWHNLKQESNSRLKIIQATYKLDA